MPVDLEARERVAAWQQARAPLGDRDLSNSLMGLAKRLVRLFKHSDRIKSFKIPYLLSELALDYWDTGDELTERL